VDINRHTNTQTGTSENNTTIAERVVDLTSKITKNPMNTKKCNERHRKRSADRLSGDVGYSRYSDGSVTWGD